MLVEVGGGGGGGEAEAIWTDIDDDRADALLAEESCTPIVKVEVPAVAGCPEIMPEAELILSPEGKDPVATDQ